MGDLKSALDKGYYPSTFPLESLTFSKITGNIFRTNDPFATSGYLGSDGLIKPNASYKTSGFASVKEEETYYLFGAVEGGKQVARFAMTYDHDLKPVRYLSYAETITIENGEEYLRISGLVSKTLGASLDPSRPTDHSAIIPLDVIEKDVIEKEAVSHIDNKIQVDMPTGFNWSQCPIRNKIYQNYFGESYVDFDVAEYKNSQNTVCYVSPKGDDTNTGGLYDPVRTMSAAYNKGTDTIVVRGGYYNVTQSVVSVTRNVNIIAFEGETPVLTSHSGSVFTVYQDSTYSATRSTITDIFDRRVIDKYGYWTKYIKVDSIAQVIATAGSYAHINGVLYIHCLDGSDPNYLQNGQLILCSASTPIVITDNCDVYLEGLTCVAGSRALFAEHPASDGEMRVFGKNCTFIGSGSTNYDCVQLKGTTLSYFQNCTAVHSKKDGFNYHLYNNVTPKAIEVNCKGRFNGNDTDAANQGSTMHDGGVIVRVGCIYTNNHGSNIADEADAGMNTQAWMIGCVSIESVARYASQNMGFYSYTNCSLWLDTCVAIKNTYCIGGGGDIHVRNPKFNGTVSPEGVTYTDY